MIDWLIRDGAMGLVCSAPEASGAASEVRRIGRFCAATKPPGTGVSRSEVSACAKTGDGATRLRHRHAETAPVARARLRRSFARPVLTMKNLNAIKNLNEAIE